MSNLVLTAYREEANQLHAERETLHAHLRAIVANPDPEWTGWRHAVEMLIPDSKPRLDELQDDLRAKGLTPLADRLGELRTDEEDR